MSGLSPCLPGCDRLGHVPGQHTGSCTRRGSVLLPGPLDLVHQHPDIPVHTPVRDTVGAVLAQAMRDELGIIAYDLQPPDPADLPRTPAYSPFRRHMERQPQSRYTPPPLPEGYARVALDDDYYAGPQWADWAGEDEAYPARVFDIPAGQRERWAKAQADYAAMQEEIGALRDARLAKPGWVPEGWVRKGDPYQVQP
jgi:hypothetical protein